MLRAAKTIVLQACDVENTLERTSVMAPKGVSLILATYYAAGHSNVTNCAKKTCMLCMFGVLDTINKSETHDCERNLSPMILKGNQMVYS